MRTTTGFADSMKSTIVAVITLLVLASAACSGDGEADTDAPGGSGSTPTPWPTRVERENVVSHRGGDKGCEAFHELEEGYRAAGYAGGAAAGAFADQGAHARIRLMIIQMSLFVNNAEPPITETVDALLRATEQPATPEELAPPLADLAKACADAGY